MTRDEIRQLILEQLLLVAPDIDPGDLDPGDSIRDQVDFDSMDQLNFALGLHRGLGLDIPERDYPRLHSLDSAVDYISGRLGSGDTPASSR